MTPHIICLKKYKCLFSILKLVAKTRKSQAVTFEHSASHKTSQCNYRHTAGCYGSGLIFKTQGAVKV